MAAGRSPSPIFPGAPLPWAGARSSSLDQRGWLAASSVTPPLRSAPLSRRPRSSAANPLSGRASPLPRRPLHHVEPARPPARCDPLNCGNGGSLHPRPALSTPQPQPAFGSKPGRRHAPPESGLTRRVKPRSADPLVRPPLMRARVAAGWPNRGLRLRRAPEDRHQPPPTGKPPNGAGRLPQIGGPVAPLVLRQHDLTRQIRSAVITKVPVQPGLDIHTARESAST